MGKKNFKLTVSIVKYLNPEKTRMECTKHVNGRQGKRIKIEKQKKKKRLADKQCSPSTSPSSSID
jgi:hypothetical protein